MKRYIKSAFSKDVNTLSDIEDEIFLAIQAGTTKDDIEDYLIELEQDGTIDKDEFNDLKQSAFAEFDRFKEAFGCINCSDDFIIRTPKKLDEAYLNYKGTHISKHMPKSKQAELRRTKAEYKNEMNRLSKEYKQYIYRCVAEAPQVPDPDDGEEAWSAYTRDAKEYKDWCFIDGVEDGLFENTDSDHAAFERLWEQAETDMAQPYA